MLINPGEIGLALDTQSNSPLVFLPSGFLAFRGGLGKDRNIPSGETALFSHRRHPEVRASSASLEGWMP